MRRAAVWAVWAIGVLAACREQAPAAQPAPAPAPAAPQPSAARTRADYDAPRAPTPPGATEPETLPEDPVAGKLAEQQWREHLEHEEEERQALYDRRRMREHRAVVRQIRAVRARYDRAKSEAALTKAREAAEKELGAIEQRVHAIDPDGVNSRLLGEYGALQTSLRGDYATARGAALSGDSAQLAAARAAFDHRLETIDEWLEEASEAGEEEH
ncbi:MAG TPA: hypothetical protein VJV78_39735 [Polyangiales bacterium]|nr:hypothetical protein [Polyangiales bacterium]